MGLRSSLPRLRSCSRRFVYSTSRRSHSTDFGTTEAGVTSHVFPSNSSRLRNPIFLSPLGISAGTEALQSQPSLAFCSCLYNDTKAAKPANGATQINNNHELNIDDTRDTARVPPLGISSGALAPQSQPSTSFCHNNPNHEDQYQLDTNTAMLENEGMQTNDSCSDFGDLLEQVLDVSVPDTGFLGNGGMQNNDYYGNDILNTNTAEAPVELLTGAIVLQLNRSQPSPSLCDYNPNHENQNEPNTNNAAMLKNGGMQTNDYCPGDEVQQRDFSSSDDLIEQIPSDEAGQDTAASTNEDSNEGNAQKAAFKTKQGRRKTSVVWTAFEEVFDKDGTVTKVKCKSCPEVFRPSKSSSTTHLLRHMNKFCTNNIASKNEQNVDQIELPQEKRKKQVATFLQSKVKKGRTVSKLIHEFSPISDAVELKKPPSSRNLDSSIRNVMKCVCTLEGVEEGSDLYRIAARIFQNREKREMFVVMEKPHLQLTFLKDEAKFLGERHFFI